MRQTTRDSTSAVVESGKRIRWSAQSVLLIEFISAGEHFTYRVSGARDLGCERREWQRRLPSAIETPDGSVVNIFEGLIRKDRDVAAIAAADNGNQHADDPRVVELFGGLPFGHRDRLSALISNAAHPATPAAGFNDDAEIDFLAHVTQSRMTQIMKLLLLAPDIQEALLFLPRVERGKDPVTERDLRAVVAEVDWGRQREMTSRFNRS